MLGSNVFRSTARVRKASYICQFCQNCNRNGRVDSFRPFSGGRAHLIGVPGRFARRRTAAMNVGNGLNHSTAGQSNTFEPALSSQSKSYSQETHQKSNEEITESASSQEPGKTSWLRSKERRDKKPTEAKTFKPSSRKPVKGTAKNAKSELMRIVRKIAQRNEPDNMQTQEEPTQISEEGPTEESIATPSDKPAKTIKSEKKKADQANTNPSFVNYDLSDFAWRPLKVKQSTSAPRLAHGLDRVLFNPGVCFLQDPRSRVYNFDPYLENIMPVADFDFSALRDYITSSKDTALRNLARRTKSRYIGSTSSMTSVLSQFHFLISKWRPINTKMMSQGFKVDYESFAKISRLPVSIFLRYKDGVYAIDADKEFDEDTILSMLGHSLEKLLTLDPAVYDKFHKTRSHALPQSVRKADDVFQYTIAENILMRSQLDAHDPRLPGSGMFDLKTRSVVSIRMNPGDTSIGAGYQIKTADGQWESFEREYYDMIRSAFLKYSLQVRIGRMDGIFVTYHNTERIFGFQYVSVDELDNALHGSSRIGDLEFKYSLSLLSKALDAATAKFPNQSLRIHFETRPIPSDFMYIFAEPISDEKIDEIQSSKRRQLVRYAREVQKNLRKKQEKAKKAAALLKTSQNGAEASGDDAISAGVGALEDEAEGETYAMAAEDKESPALSESDGPQVLDPDWSKDTRPQESKEANEASGSLADLYEIKSAIAGSESVRSVEASKNDNGSAQGVLEEESISENSTTSDGEISSFQASGDVSELSVLEETELAEEAVTTKSVPGEQIEEVEAASFSSPEGLEVENGITEPDSQRNNPNSTAETEPNSEVELSAALADTIKADTSEAASLGQFKEDYENKELVGLTLEVKNWINGTETRRPEKLGFKDKWNITFALKEITSVSQARTRYEQLRKRRIDGLLRSDDKTNNRYFENLDRLSREGRRWLEQQKKIDSRRRTVVFSPIRGSPRGFQGAFQGAARRSREGTTVSKDSAHFQRAKGNSSSSVVDN